MKLSILIYVFQIFTFIFKTENKRKFNHKSNKSEFKTNPKLPPNSEYLGIGYNIFYANPNIYPINQNQDPGFRKRIFEVKTSDELTSDEKYSKPKGWNILSVQVCSASLSNEKYVSESDYSDSLTLSLGLKINLSYSFGANSEYKSISKSFSNGDTLVIENKAICSSYMASIKENSLPKLSDQFKNDLKEAIKIPNSIEAFYQLIEDYGTHYFKTVYMGSKYIYTSEISDEKLSESEIDAKSIELFVSKEFKLGENLKMEGKISISGSSDTNNTISEKIFTIQSRMSFTGSQYTTDAISWSQNTNLSPSPISYNIIGIETIFSDQNIIEDLLNSGFQQNQINLIREYYKNSLSNNYYCNNYLVKKGLISGCEKTYPVKLSEYKTTQNGFLYLNVDCKKSAIYELNAKYSTDRDIFFEYKCIYSEKITSRCYHRQTDLKEYDPYYSLKLGHLSNENFNINCSDDEVLTQFNFESESKFIYGLYKCCETKNKKYDPKLNELKVMKGFNYNYDKKEFIYSYSTLEN